MTAVAACWSALVPLHESRPGNDSVTSEREAVGFAHARRRSHYQDSSWHVIAVLWVCEAGQPHVAAQSTRAGPAPRVLGPCRPASRKQSGILQQLAAAACTTATCCLKALIGVG